jgi:hypothetical protein
METTMNTLRCPVIWILTVVALGCRHRGVDLPTSPVSGRVTYRGKPLEFGQIAFVHSSGQVAGSELATDGGFKVTAYQGVNRIFIECRDIDKPGTAQKRPWMANDRPKSLIPDRYRSYGTSGLTFDVKPGDNTTEFALKD